jgi:hypothetical protein
VVYRCVQVGVPIAQETQQSAPVSRMAQCHLRQSIPDYLTQQQCNPKIPEHWLVPNLFAVEQSALVARPMKDYLPHSIPKLIAL